MFRRKKLTVQAFKPGDIVLVTNENGEGRAYAVYQDFIKKLPIKIR